MFKFTLTKKGRKAVNVILLMAIVVGILGSIKSGLIKFDKKKPTT